ncbi:MAG: hypothetical protein JWO81_2213 [Alphaproteobacteria bacterium]|nr:hypothetical protein [Alphaproteobacteria bacterium]
MSRLKQILVLVASAAASAGSAAPPAGPIIILSDEYGRGINIGGQVDARQSFAPGSYAAADLADAFKKLCLDTAFDPAALGGTASVLDLVPGQIVLASDGKTPAFEQGVLQSPAARVSIWTGDEAGLRKRPILIRDRGALVTSGYGPFKALGKQCNFDAKLSGLSSVDAFVMRMSADLGAQPAKLVAKGSYADGYWTLTGDVRVSFSAVDLNKPAQLLHVVAQVIPAKVR